MDDAFALGRDFHSNDVRNALSIQLCTVRVGQREARAVIFRRLFRGNLVPSHIGQFFRGAIAFERMAIGQQPVAMLGVNRASFGLAVRPVRAADIGAFVPAKA